MLCLIPLSAPYTPQTQCNSESCHLQNLFYDSAVVGFVSRGQETEYRELVDLFVSWCGDNYLPLNVTKTKEMVIDFKKTRAKR